MSSRKGQQRIEIDEFGEVTIPAGAYWGAGTSRAVSLFSASGRSPHPALVTALVQVKKASAITNGELGLLGKQTASAICQVCDEFLSGQWRDQIVVDAIHGGAGIGLLINVSEFIANRASEILGDPLESLNSVEPSKHVDLSQSTNDVYTTAMRVAILASVKKLESTVLEMERLLRRKSLEFERVVKVGRTCLRDDAPVTLGQEFNCYGSTIERALRRIKDARVSLEEIGLGGRSVGTGFNTMPDYAIAASRNLANVTGLALRPAEDYLRLIQSMSDFVAFSSSLRELATDLAKIAADLRLMSSGPAAGFSEIKLNDTIMHSGIWPDVLPKIGIPPLTETLQMACYQVIGNDHVVSISAQAGQLESNSLTPLMIDSMLTSISMLTNVLNDFNHHCLIKITANTSKCRQTFDKSSALIAALTSEVGYQKALDITQKASEHHMDVRDYLQSTTIISRTTLDKILHYKYLTTPHLMAPGSPPDDSDQNNQ